MTIEIVKTKPSKIVVEDLNVSGMLKDRYISKAVQNQCFNKILTYLEYKCKFFGIEFVKANRWFASSKLCSCCRHKKVDLNASINLAKYTK